MSSICQWRAGSLIDLSVDDDGDVVASMTTVRHYTVAGDEVASNDRALAHESPLEPKRLGLADFDPTATAIRTQPFQVTGRDGGDLRTHVPDLLLAHSDRRTLEARRTRRL